MVQQQEEAEPGIQEVSRRLNFFSKLNTGDSVSDAMRILQEQCVAGEANNGICTQTCTNMEGRFVQDHTGSGFCGDGDSNTECEYRVRFPMASNSTATNNLETASAASQSCTWVIDRRQLVTEAQKVTDADWDDLWLQGTFKFPTDQPADARFQVWFDDSKLYDQTGHAGQRYKFNALHNDYKPVDVITIKFESPAANAENSEFDFVTWPVQTVYFNYWTAGLIFFAVLLGVILIGGVVLWIVWRKTKEKKKAKRLRNQVDVTDVPATVYEGEEIPCGICLLNIEEGQMVKRLNCPENHVYHVACIDQHSSSGGGCPQCRCEQQYLSPDSVQPVVVEGEPVITAGGKQVASGSPLAPVQGYPVPVQPYDHPVPVAAEADDARSFLDPTTDV